MSWTRDLFRRVVNQDTPVPYTAKSTPFSFQTGGVTNTESIMSRVGVNGTLYSIIDLLSSSTASVCWKLYRKKPNDSKVERVQVTSHLALDLWNKPNDFFTQQLFVQTFQQHKDLVGEFWWVVSRSTFGWPESIWVVRPDRISPIPDPKQGVTGYIYLSPDGEKIPLGLDEVIRARTPNPLEPGPAGRGLGPVQSILANLDAARYSAEWNRNFFLNSAIPGGVITVPTSLADREFDRLRAQWSEQHRGISAAHRVGILENGAAWNSVQSNQRDMQFAEMAALDEGLIRKAYRVHPHMLGDSSDVNLANAQAADYTFSQWSLVPRLDAIKDVLNSAFLPMFGPFGRGTGQPDVEFDYDNPVPENREEENNDVKSKAVAFKTYIDAGVTAEDAALLVGIPPVQMRQVDPVPTGGGSEKVQYTS